MKFQVLKVTEEGRCEKCGRPCPRRRVLVQPLDADGNRDGDPQAWGVNCAAQVKYGKKTPKLQQTILFEAEAAERDRLYTEKQKLARVAVVGQSYSFGGPVVECKAAEANGGPLNLANRLYHRTGRNIVGSYFATNGDGHVVRVDGRDRADVEFYAARGFVQAGRVVEEAI